MSQIHGRNAIVEAWDSAGASQNIAGDLNSWTLSWSRDNPDVTVFSKDTVHRISGLRDVTFDIAGIWNSGGSSKDLLSNAASGSSNTLLKVYPARVAGSPFFTGCFLLNSYNEAAIVTAAVTFGAAFQIASGSLSASVV
jgi:hypothetical protein